MNNPLTSLLDELNAFLALPAPSPKPAGAAAAFDEEGRPLLYLTAPGGAYCPTCVDSGAVPYGLRIRDAVPRSRGVGGRCDGCGGYGPHSDAPACSAVARLVVAGLDALPDHEDGRDPWACLVYEGPARETPPSVVVHIGDAVYRCRMERIR